MKPEIATIISALITNIGYANTSKNSMYIRHIQANRAIEGISKLEELWPNLTEEEKQEFKAVIKAIETTYRDTTKAPEDYCMMRHY